MKNNLHWATGLFEGEGSISQDGHHWQLQIAMTDLDVLEDFADYFGLKVNGPYQDRPHTKPIFRVKTKKKSKVRAMLDEMLPYLGQRRAYKALNALDDLELSI